MKETNCSGGSNIVFMGSGMQIEFIWLRVGCGDGHIWTDGVFYERWGITCLARWLSGSYEDCSREGHVFSAVNTHTHSSEQCSYIFAICPIFLFHCLISCSHSPKLETALHFYPSITYTLTLFHITYMALRCFAHLLPNWSLLFKLSILYSVFMHFKYCVYGVTWEFRIVS